MRKIKIGSKTVGEKCPVLIIAEVGVNHGSSLEKAHHMIDIAADAGVDVIKFQTFTADGLVSRKKNASEWQLFKKYELPYKYHAELKEHTEKRGCIFMSTPSDNRDVDFLTELGVTAFKVGSDDSTNYPFLRYIAEKKLPIILSTGLCTFAEVVKAVSAIWSAGNDSLIILQCTTSYPSETKYANLRAIKTMHERLHILAGYSSHVIGNTDAVAAVALGAVVIEKHFTYDRKAAGPDHIFSLDPEGLRALVCAVREVEEALGSPHKKPAKIERDKLISFRKSIVATRDIPVGTEITEEMVTAKRPGCGIPAGDIKDVIGMRAQKFIGKDDVITWKEILRRE